jgi:hypothetical protein
MSRIALITGATGQDGAGFASHLTRAPQGPLRVVVFGPARASARATARPMTPARPRDTRPIPFFQLVWGSTENASTIGSARKWSAMAALLRPRWPRSPYPISLARRLRSAQPSPTPTAAATRACSQTYSRPCSARGSAVFVEKWPTTALAPAVHVNRQPMAAGAFSTQPRCVCSARGGVQHAQVLPAVRSDPILGRTGFFPFPTRTCIGGEARHFRWATRND